MAKNGEAGAGGTGGCFWSSGGRRPQDGGAVCWLALFFRIRLYACICLFVAYVILDYTKASVGTVDSSRIYAEIERDLAEDMELRGGLVEGRESVRISGAEDAETSGRRKNSEMEKPETEEPEDRATGRRKKIFPSPDKMEKVRDDHKMRQTVQICVL